MNSDWCSWSIYFQEGFHNGPDILGRNFTVSCFRVPSFKYLSPGHSSDRFSNPVNC
jgi:hypothetical protein